MRSSSEPLVYLFSGDYVGVSNASALKSYKEIDRKIEARRASKKLIRTSNIRANIGSSHVFRVADTSGLVIYASSE